MAVGDTLVIRALGLIVGKIVRDEGGGSDLSDLGDLSDVYRKTFFLLTEVITQAAHVLL